MSGGSPHRRAGIDDVGVVLGLFDSAVAWLAAHGFAAQWGDRPWSEDPRRVDQVASWLRGDGSWLAETADGIALGFLHLGPAPSYVPEATVPETYVVALVTSRAPASRGVGRALLELAVRNARELGSHRVRVDCYAGNGGRLVAFYESCGFTSVGEFTVGNGWTGRVLARDVR